MDTLSNHLMLIYTGRTRLARNLLQVSQGPSPLTYGQPMSGGIFQFPALLSLAGRAKELALEGGQHREDYD